MIVNGGGGRGGGRSNERTTDTISKKSAERELKFAPVSNQGKNSVATYATTRDAVIQHIRRTYTGGIDVGESIEAMKMVDLTVEEPTRTLTTETDAARMLVDQKGLDMKYQARLTRHLDREDALREGLDKAYNLIFTNYCTMVMQARIEQHPDYETKLKNNPIATLEAIKTLMHNSVRAQYPMVTMSGALDRLMNVRQQENESLLDYVKRFKQLRDVVASQMGTKFLDEFVEHQTLYPAAASAMKKTMKAEAYSQWTAYLLLRGSDQRKYGSLLTGFTSQFSLGNNQYPKTIMTACDALSNHKIDERFYNNMMKRKNNERQPTERSSSENDDQSQANKSFAQPKSAMICYCCGKEGHPSTQCEQRSVIPREEWYIKQAIQNLQEIDNEPNDELIDNVETVPTTPSSSTPSANRRSDQTTSARRERRAMIPWSG
jgi:hypothetical protein